MAHTHAADPAWSESWRIALTGAEGPDVKIHFVHRPGTIGVIEETVVVSVAANRSLAGRGFAPLGNGRLSAAGVDLDVIEPFRRSSLRFHGALREVATDELDAGPLLDGAFVDTLVELRLTSVRPPVPLAGSGWGGGHYAEQVDAEGVFTDEHGQRRAVRCAGVVEHRWGPLDWAAEDGWELLEARFPDGRSFVVRYQGAEVRGWVTDGGPPRVVRAADLPGVGGGSAHLWTDDGEVRVDLEPARTVPFTLFPPAEVTIGTDRDPRATHHVLEGSAHCRWGNSEGLATTVTAVRSASTGS